MLKLDRTEPCPHCGRFVNRGVTVDAVIVNEGDVLLIRRGVEPDKGFWGTPGGYVGWDESTEEAVAREVAEETGLEAGLVRLVGVYSSPSRHPKQAINILYLVEVEEGDLTKGDDAAEAAWFPRDSLPEQMALDHRQNVERALKLLAGEKVGGC